MNTKGFIFQTERGNSYFYDNTIGAVLPVGEDIINKSNKDISQPIIYAQISKEKIEEHLENYGYKQLILIVTENCNLSCKYCIFSENYTNTRVARNINMDFEIAKEAVEKYLHFFSKVKTKNPFLIPTIGFYGGETLLNFELIRKVVNHAIEIYNQKIHFAITTNAVLLNDEMINFFVNHNFGFSVSLNGYKAEHDRLRIYPNGSGTFDVVTKKLKKIKKQYPEYFKLFCNIIACYDTGTDLLKVRDFFVANEENLPNIGRISSISTSFTNWYDQYSQQEKEVFTKSLRECKRIYFQQIKLGEVDPFLEALIGSSYFRMLNRAINIPLTSIRPSYLPYTGACTPGDKIAVSPDGNIHCCEKINDKFPIGSVESWLDYTKIMTLIDRFNKEITMDCWECPISRLCPVCYIQSAGNGNFEKSELNNCKRILANMKMQFKEIWSLLEDGVPVSRFLKEDSEYF